MRGTMGSIRAGAALIDSDGSTDTWWTVAEKLLAKNELSGDEVRAIVADFEAKK